MNLLDFVNEGLANSEPDSNRNFQVLATVLPILAVLMSLSAVVYAFTKKKKRSYMKGQGKANDLLPFFNRCISCSEKYKIS